MSAPVPTAEEIMAATGLIRKSALVRLTDYRRGRRSLESLLAPKHERSGDANTNGWQDSDWGDLGLGPRICPEDILGPTALELRVFGREAVQEVTADSPRPGRVSGRKPSWKTALVNELAELCGISTHTAYRRIRAYKRGGITHEELYAPAGMGRRRGGNV